MTIKIHARATIIEPAMQDAGFVSQAVTFGGGQYTLRMLRPDDAPRVQQFFYTHTRETIQMRYGHAVARMTDQRAMELVSVDQSRDVALAILAETKGREAIHAIGRYYLDPDGRSAEVAFVVRESKRRFGMGSLLLRTLMDIAQSRGLTSIWGRVRRDNLPMLALFRRFGGSTVGGNNDCDGDVDVRVPLRPVKKRKKKSAAASGTNRIRKRRKLG